MAAKIFFRCISIFCFLGSESGTAWATRNRTVDMSTICDESTFDFVSFPAEKDPVYVVWNGDAIRKCRITFEPRTQTEQLCTYVVRNKLAPWGQYVRILIQSFGTDSILKGITFKDLPNIPYCADTGYSLSIVLRNTVKGSTENNSIILKVILTEESFGTSKTFTIVVVTVSLVLVLVLIACLLYPRGMSIDTELEDDDDDENPTMSEFKTSYSESDFNIDRKCSVVSS